MQMSQKQLARIPKAPRAKWLSKGRVRVVQTQKDHALCAVARMVVAGVDKKYGLHPYYRRLVKLHGFTSACDLIEAAVKGPGGCDVIQTDMCYAGIGLFGGLSKNCRHFTFHEWVDAKEGQLHVSMTIHDARDIVSGKKRTIRFRKISKR